jgi:hypothetical protein
MGLFQFSLLLGRKVMCFSLSELISMALSCIHMGF